jgi:hypothetical protein
MQPFLRRELASLRDADGFVPHPDAPEMASIRRADGFDRSDRIESGARPGLARLSRR